MNNKLTVAKLLSSMNLKKNLENKDIKIFIQDYLHYLNSISVDDKELLKELFMLEPKHYKKIPKDIYAYMAAIIETFSKDNQIATPQWIYDSKYYLNNPWYPPEVEKYPRVKKVLSEVSPEPFRVRNLFVSENALSVC